MIPVLLSCDAYAAYERRITQRGKPGVLEHYALAGGSPSGEAFLIVQARCQAAFEGAAGE